MKSACSSFGGGNLKASLIKGLPKNATGTYVIPSQIQDISALFTELQEKRHLADYDRSECFIRSEVMTLIGETRAYVANFRAMPSSDDRKYFLACLLAWKELTSR